MTFEKRRCVNSGEALGLIKMAGSHSGCMGEGKMTVFEDETYVPNNLSILFSLVCCLDSFFML